MKRLCIPKHEKRAKINWLGFIPIPVRTIQKVVIDFQFLEESKYDWEGDKDQEDWNKLGGLTFNLYPRNKDALLIGWRYSPEKEAFEVVAYINENGDNLPIESKMIEYIANERGSVEITRKGKEFKYTFFKESGISWQEMTTVTLKIRKGFWFAFRSEPWFGGENNSKGQYGGKHYKDICFNWSMKIK